MRAKTTEQANTGVEPEDVAGEGAPETGVPLDPTPIRIETKPLAIDHLVSRVKADAIDLYPEFQPKAGLWSPVEQSRLIESLLVRVPWPAFYFDASDDKKWLVVDGLQRLSTLKAFVLDKKLKLKGLEFLADLKGKKFDGLPRHFQRRILETQVTACLLREGAPPEVKFNIFRRINTGGTPLDAQQIRHALNQGQATRFLKLLAKSKDFKQATAKGVSDAGLADQECVLRFLAFRMTPYTEYRCADLERFLAEAMTRLNGVDGKTLRALRDDLARALRAATAIFGAEAFRKRFTPDDPPRPVNKGLFEAWTVALARLDDAQIKALVARGEGLKEDFMKMMSNESRFVESLSHATGEPKKVNTRFEGIENLIRKHLDDHQPDPEQL